MKIFLSWSGSSSRQFAKLFHDFISDVMPWTQVYLSDEEIESGERWLSNISDALESSSYGVIFLTKSNVSAPWVLFEAGALSKFISDSRVVPLLCDLSDIDLTGNPLSHFQYRKLVKDDVERLVKDINSKADIAVGWERVSKTFGKFWPDYAPKFEELQKNLVEQSGKIVKSAKVDSDGDMSKILDALNELLNLNRVNSFKISTASDVADSVSNIKFYNSPRARRANIQIDDDHKIIINDKRDGFDLINIKNGNVVGSSKYEGFVTTSEIIRSAKELLSLSRKEYDL